MTPIQILQKAVNNLETNALVAANEAKREVLALKSAEEGKRKLPDESSRSGEKLDHGHASKRLKTEDKARPASNGSRKAGEPRRSAGDKRQAQDKRRPDEKEIRADPKTSRHGREFDQVREANRAREKEKRAHRERESNRARDKERRPHHVRETDRAEERDRIDKAGAKRSKRSPSLDPKAKHGRREPTKDSHRDKEGRDLGRGSDRRAPTKSSKQEASKGKDRKGNQPDSSVKRSQKNGIEKNGEQRKSTQHNGASEEDRPVILPPVAEPALEIQEASLTHQALDSVMFPEMGETISEGVQIEQAEQAATEVTPGIAADQQKRTPVAAVQSESLAGHRPTHECSATLSRWGALSLQEFVLQPLSMHILRCS